jgi:hypothetical protein
MGEVNALAVLEVLDREGQVRQSHRVAAWPVRIGRALDNDLSISDPHVAAHHAVIDHDGGDLVLQALDTHNGVQIGGRRLRAGERESLRDDGTPLELTAGRTRLRLRLAGEALAAELPLAASATWLRRIGPTLAAGAGLALALAFTTWLDSDPDTFARALGAATLTTVMGAAAWVAMWALLSKTFTRQTHADWHLKVFLFSSLAWLLIGVVPDLLAFSLSWTWAGDFGFLLGYAVGAAALYFHLSAVEPGRLKLMRGVAVLAFIGGVGLTLWSNQQRSDRLGAELYMGHLFPPALRVAKAVPVDRFVGGMTSLQPVLDGKAKEAPLADGGTGGSDEE